MTYAAYDLGQAFGEQLQGLMPFERCREIAERHDGFSPDLWKEIASSGWLEIGAGGDDAPFEAVLSTCEVAGTHLLPGPFTATATFTGPLLAAWSTSLAAAAASGDAIVASVVPSLRSAADRVDIALPVATLEEGFLTLAVDLAAVPFAAHATHLFCPFEDEDGVAAVAVVALPDERAAVGSDARVDLTCPSPPVALVGALGTGEVFAGSGLRDDLVAATLRHMHGLTAESVGGIGAILRQTIPYVSERVQFGVPVGSFQSLKHALADVHVAYELGRGLTFGAGGRIGTEPAAAAADVLAARIFTADAYLSAAETAIQAHGGAGFTWEQGLHYWYRAALRLRSAPTPVTELRRIASDVVSTHLAAAAALSSGTA